MEIYNKVLNYIKKHNLIEKNDKIICAVSGGADSVCMLDLLAAMKDELSLTLYVAHLNHCLREKEADRDEEFVRKLSRHYSLPFFSKRVNVEELSCQLKVSCEEAGRIARYDFFEELKKTLNCKKIATAHTQNDNIETVLMRIIRGTDLKGLSGIPLKNDSDAIRPILCLNRDEIEKHLECKGIDFVTDSTNLENNFSRNKIRNILIPAIRENFNPSIISTLSANIENFTEANLYIENKVNDFYNKSAEIGKNYCSFDIESLLREDAYIVKRIIKKAVFETAHVNITQDMCNLIFSAMSETSSVTISKNISFYAKYGRAYFVKNDKKLDFSYKITDLGTYAIKELDSTIEVSEVSEKLASDNKNTLYLDADKVKCDFVLRSKKNGDKIYLEKCGTKKLKDIFIDEKIPVFMRDNFPVLEYDNKIIWLCTLRYDSRFSTKNNNKYLKITIHKENNHE